MSSGTTPGIRRGSFSFLGAFAVVAAIILGACGADDDGLGPVESAPASAPSTASATDTGLAAVVDQFREDEILHLLQVRVTNHGDVTYRISSMQLDWPGLTTVDPTPRDTLVVPGQTIDVPIDYGTAVCAEHPPGADEPVPTTAATAVATVTPDGATSAEQVTIPVTDELHIFDRVFPSSCRDQRVEAAVAMRFGDSWTPSSIDGRPALAGTLDVQRSEGDEAVTINSVGGSVLLDVHAAGGATPALSLAPGSASAQIPVVIDQSGNCSGHALTESKKTFILPVEVVLGSDAPIPYEVTIDVAARPQFTDMINTACGLGTELTPELELSRARGRGPWPACRGTAR